MRAGDLAVKIFGPDLNTLADLAGQIQHTLSRRSRCLGSADGRQPTAWTIFDSTSSRAAGRAVRRCRSTQCKDALRAQVEGCARVSWRKGRSGRRSSSEAMRAFGRRRARASPIWYQLLRLMARSRVGDYGAESRAYAGAGQARCMRAWFTLRIWCRHSSPGRDLVGAMSMRRRLRVATKVRLPAGYPSSGAASSKISSAPRHA